MELTVCETTIGVDVSINRDGCGYISIYESLHAHVP